MEYVNLRENLHKTSSKLLLQLPTYFDDVTTIENNRQVRVNIDVTLVAIFRITSWDHDLFRLMEVVNFYFKHGLWQLSRKI